MAQDQKAVKKVYVCPAHFCREVDFELSYDPDEDNYYCNKCCYEGTAEEIEQFYREFTSRKYKNM